MALDLFSAGRSAKWHNRLIWGDKPTALRFLPAGTGRGGGNGTAGGFVCAATAGAV